MFAHAAMYDTQQSHGMDGSTYDAAPVRIFSDQRQFDTAQNAYLSPQNTREHVRQGGNRLKNEPLHFATSKAPRGKDNTTGQSLIVDQDERLMPYNNPNYAVMQSNHQYVPASMMYTQGDATWLRR